ncbi:hypothetical protein SKAU_G00353560 [Synaphobranchus kaupii]|uniref:Peptidase S9 prolyl oligopeptidase catalytic domain-containing protein n=1 Tax=Synaphobranchus kaupii TaxID=118154 RepID=A0A9Q1IG88_SYNKA|nr:hypothetical protein SKAU_G00353560 [Synaphobranchus kaupii]
MAIHSWSYRGFLSLMGLLQRPDVFKASLTTFKPNLVLSLLCYFLLYSFRFKSRSHMLVFPEVISGVLACVQVAVVEAPVAVWTYNNTGYPEMYIGHLDHNEDSYQQRCKSARQNGNTTKAISVPPGRLLLLHGVLDGNVHFTHTSMLFSQLICVGKPYLLQVSTIHRRGTAFDKGKLVSMMSSTSYTTYRRTCALKWLPSTIRPDLTMQFLLLASRGGCPTRVANPRHSR